MIDLLAECRFILNETGHSTTLFETNRLRALVFEGATILGFAIIYADASELLSRWNTDATALIMGHQLGLRRAQDKAWNTYTVIMASDEPTYGELVALGAIEEDLTGTRKIARAGVRDIEGLRSALLPLLPIQNAPRLDAVDMPTEIKLRTTELPPRIVEAFLSEAQESLVFQVLEEEQ